MCIILLLYFFINIMSSQNKMKTYLIQLIQKYKYCRHNIDWDTTRSCKIVECRFRLINTLCTHNALAFVFARSGSLYYFSLSDWPGRQKMEDDNDIHYSRLPDVGYATEIINRTFIRKQTCLRAFQKPLLCNSCRIFIFTIWIWYSLSGLWYNLKFIVYFCGSGFVYNSDFLL